MRSTRRPPPAHSAEPQPVHHDVDLVEHATGRPGHVALVGSPLACASSTRSGSS